MSSIINASVSSNGIVSTADASGIILLQSNGTNTNSRAWVNFNGGNGNTAGVINSSYNVSSITVNGTGDYTINFTTAMGSANYAWSASMYRTNSANNACASTSAPTTTALRIVTTDVSFNSANAVTASVVIHS